MSWRILLKHGGSRCRENTFPSHNRLDDITYVFHIFQHGGSWRRKSLIEDAKFETAANIEFEKQERKSRGGSISEEEEVFLSQQNGEVIAPIDKDALKRQFTIMMSLKDGMTSLSRIIRVFEVC